MDSPAAFSNSNDMRGSSGMCCIDNAESLVPEATATEIAALRRVSDSLQLIFDSTMEFDFFSDAKIVLSGGEKVAVHRCILSARSLFFRNVFSGKDGGVELELKELAKDVDVSVDALTTVLAYLYTGKVRSLPKGVCVCVDEECSHIACRPALDFMLEVLYASFVFQISELVALYQRHLVDILDKVAADDIVAVLAVANICGKACEKVSMRCIENIVRSDVDVITLDRTLPQHIVQEIMHSRVEIGLHWPESNSFPDKHVKRIHRALDSEDVELVQLLLQEGHTTLDDANALHYAVAYCDAKTTIELLDLGLADVNCRNTRGYSVLHIAAMRKEPKILLSLLIKGARPFDRTLDGRKALQIAKRLTRAVDYRKSTERGKESPKDRLCIEILEQAERKNSLLGEGSISHAVAGDTLRIELLYLENRVLLAKILFPMEAKVAMEIAHVDRTSEFPLAAINSKTSVGTKRTALGLLEPPFELKEEHLNRLRALSKTVELGKLFFPRCSEVLNKIMTDADDLSELANIENETAEERQLKKQRYMEILEVLSKAFDEDKQEFERSNNTSATSMGARRTTVKHSFKK